MLWLIDPPRGLTGPLPRLDKTPSNLTNRESGVKVIPLLFPSSVRNGLKPAPLGAGNGGGPGAWDATTSPSGQSDAERRDPPTDNLGLE